MNVTVILNETGEEDHAKESKRGEKVGEKIMIGEMA